MLVAIASLAILQSDSQVTSWERSQIAAIKMSLELPGTPTRLPLQIRSEAEPFIESIEAYTLTRLGVFVRASLTQYVSEFEIKMPAAINGVIASIKKESAVKNLTHTVRPIKLDGADAVRLTARYSRNSKEFRYDAVLTFDKHSLWILGCGFDATMIKSLGIASRILDSFRFYHSNSMIAWLQ